MLGGISCVTVRTLRHGSSADVSSHAAAPRVGGMVAGHDLYLVTGEMVQVGDDNRLLVDLQLHLCNKIRAQHPEIHSNLRDYFSIQKKLKNLKVTQLELHQRMTHKKINISYLFIFILIWSGSGGPQQQIRNCGEEKR